MCGISGSWDRTAQRSADALTGLATRMALALAHRGPDDAGAWVDARAGLALGHRRLAVLDLTPAGAQPMRSADERFVLCFNGEIYNCLSLRRRLLAEGASLRGTSDTEVLLEAVARWGLAAALDAVEGMFAFGLWDRRERTLSLARDRMGEKPLYVAWAGSELLFGSELGALRQHPGFATEVDPHAVAHLLQRSCIPAPGSIYRSARKLPPGHVMTVTEQTPAGSLPWGPYWDLRQVAELGLAQQRSGVDERGALEELDRLLSESVHSQLLADVPLGCFLSGGIDSSLITALAQERSSRPVRTFSLGFEEAAWDEAPHARRVAQHLGTDHVEHYVTADDALAVVPTLADVYDEPFADSSQIPTVLVSRLAREHVTVALTGDGGDELFAGYDRYRIHGRLSGVVSGVPASARRALAASLLRVPAARWDALHAAVAPVLPRRAAVTRPGEKVHKAARLLGHASTADLYTSLMSAWPDPGVVLTDDARAVLDQTLPLQDADPVRRLQHLDQSGYLPDDLLTKVDRAAMSVSLETRVPMLSRAVVEHSWTLPTRMLVSSGTGKLSLRRLLARRVPAELFERPKQGFAVPLGSWLRGPLRDWAEDLLAPAALAGDGLIDARVVRAVMDEHVEGRVDHSARLWPVLMLQAWRTAAREPSAAVAPSPTT